MNIGSTSLENTQNFQETAYLINQLIFTTFDDPVLVYDNNLTVIKVNKAYRGLANISDKNHVKRF